MKTKEKIIGILFTTAATLLNFWYMGLSVIFLNVGLVVSLVFWINFKSAYQKSFLRLYLIGILLQLAHFLEEYYTGFYKELPLLFKAEPWTPNKFVVFNVVWLFIFSLAAAGAFYKINLSFLVVWFFILVGGVGNGILHTGLTILRKEYFPGTITAILLFVLGVSMVKKSFSLFTTGDNLQSK